jgi:MFS family permease
LLAIGIAMQYKYTVLSNTMLGALMASINMNIVMITLPAIFRGLKINPFSPGEFTYLLWVLMGYSIILAASLVTFGRISDILGRAKMYTIGYVIFAIASTFLSIIPGGTGNLGAMLIISLRMVQAVGGGFLMVNSTAILIDAFPTRERGKALGINQVSFIVGSLLGLIVGGLLSGFDWHLVFVVNVPFAVVGAIWSRLTLRESEINKDSHIDYLGNATFAASLVLISVGFTYTLVPYGSSQMGWGNPYVIAALVAGILLFVAFIFVEGKVKSPLFNMSLFKIRQFFYGNIALLLYSLGRGAVMFLLIIWLQGIYLPLHGFSYSQTPFWAGIYMLPMLLGTVALGPVGGILTDKYGARPFATAGIAIVAVGLFLLTLLPYNFNVVQFFIITFLIGVGGGLFASPNTTAIMNSIPSNERATANGMRMTINNVSMTISMAMFFSVTIAIFSKFLPSAIISTAEASGVPTQVAMYLSKIPPSGALFGAFLGVSPVSALPSSLISGLDPYTLGIISSAKFFPNVIGPSFTRGLGYSMYIALALSLAGTVFSALMGKRYIQEESTTQKTKSIEENIHEGVTK